MGSGGEARAIAGRGRGKARGQGYKGKGKETEVKNPFLKPPEDDVKFLTRQLRLTGVLNLCTCNCNSKNPPRVNLAVLVFHHFLTDRQADQQAHRRLD